MRCKCIFCPAADKFIRGGYDLKVQVGKPGLIKDPVEKSNDYQGNIYEWIFDAIGQKITKTGLGAKSNGGGDGAVFLIMEIEGEERHIPLYHVHQNSVWEGVPHNKWEDSAP